MGVDDHLQRLSGRSSSPAPLPKSEPQFGDDKLFSAAIGRVSSAASVVAERPPDSSIKELRADIKKLTESINGLLGVFRKAHEDIRAEPTADLASKMDKLVEQNEEIARALLLLLELHREHLPQISKHTRISSEMRLRKPSRLLFSGSK